MPTKPKAKRRPWVAIDKRRQRGNDQFYQGKRWRYLRNSYIRKNPLCVMCGDNGIIKEGNVVDHIIPRRQGGSDYNLDNLQTLCNSCHGIKSRNERI